MDHDFDHIADSYLAELRQELGSLPREQRREILDGVAEHIAEARAAGSVRTEAELRTLIDRLGSPE
ncbi:MAG TPA: hypothetical protein VE505_21320, partial [Vicinamibacterales bacterium]|nr:hypothetical protein [Vicinamibacterales bacterium]